MIITRCEIAEVIIRRLWTYVNNPNILFLDFFLCQPLQKSKAFHLETFRFKVFPFDHSNPIMYRYKFIAEWNLAGLRPVRRTEVDGRNNLLFWNRSQNERYNELCFFVKTTPISLSHRTNSNRLNFLLCRIDTAVEGCCSNTSSDIYLTNLQSEANYVRRFLNGKQLHVASVDVKITSYFVNEISIIFKWIFLRFSCRIHRGPDLNGRSQIVL